TYGLQFKDEIDQDIAVHLVSSCLRFDRLMKSDSGVNLLRRFVAAYPDEPVFVLHRIRESLNLGLIAQAEHLARELCDLEPEIVYQRAEEVVGALIEPEQVPDAKVQ